MKNKLQSNYVHDYEETLMYSQNLTLLYVEDCPTTRRLTLDFLQKIFKNIIIAKNGKEGLENFIDNKIDLVITDIQMPIMNGLDMSKEIKSIDKTTPILILSAYQDLRTFTKAIHLDIDGYLLKPMDIKQFIQSLLKSLKDLHRRNENLEYKSSLEEMVAKKVQELRAKDKILLQQSRMASMGEMIDMIAHQWKQPLNSISMQMELLQMDMDNDTLEKENISEALDITTSQIEHLSQTMSEFRMFLRPNENIEKLNIASLLNSITVLLKDELLKHTTELVIKCADDIYIEANANDIKHLFINLINNAKDEMHVSNIESKHRKIIVESFLKNDKIEFLVSDNGLGIPKNIRDKLFHANFTTKEDIGGTGIGLYMCQQIVHKYGGTINVYNSDTGAVFKIVL